MEAERPTVATQSSVPERQTTSRHVALALTSFAAAAIHFAVMGDHFDEHFLIGLFFAVVAWGQILSGAWLLLAPGRTLLAATALGNAAVVATWGLSRTVGVPVGPDPWTAEAIGRADFLSTALELGIVAGCGLLLAGRGKEASPRRRATGPLFIYGLSLALMTSAALASDPEHSHSETTAPHGHGTDEARARGVLVGAELGNVHSGPPHFHLAGGHVHSDDHDHGGGAPAGTPDPQQLDLIKQSMERYEDVAVARREGFERMDGDYRETGAHFGIPEWTADGAYSITGDLDLAQPEYLMYTKRLTGEWKLIAVAYVVDMWKSPGPPSDLVGAPYHEHVWNCIESAGWTLDEEDYGYVSRAECESMGNMWAPGGEWMTHVWLIPNPEGVFADWNPRVF